jgi:hypothetical protein
MYKFKHFTGRTPCIGEREGVERAGRKRKEWEWRVGKKRGSEWREEKKWKGEGKGRSGRDMENWMFLGKKSCLRQ